VNHSQVKSHSRTAVSANKRRLTRKEKLGRMNLSTSSLEAVIEPISKAGNPSDPLSTMLRILHAAVDNLTSRWRITVLTHGLFADVTGQGHSGSFFDEVRHLLDT
jgi:hypothetical protein